MIQFSRRRRPFAAFAVAAGALVLAAGAVLAGCTSSPHQAANPPPGPVPQVAPADTTRPPQSARQSAPPRSASASASHSARPTPSTRSPSPSSSSTTPVVRRAQPCRTSGLSGSVGAPTGSAGSFYYPIQFTNKSGSACTLYGYPGVSVVTSPGGSQVGPQAVRAGTFAARLIKIAANAVVHATMRMPNPGIVGSGCLPKTVRWLRVFPPGQFSALNISVPTTPNAMQICTGTHLGGIVPIAIYVVMPGASGP